MNVHILWGNNFPHKIAYMYRGILYAHSAALCTGATKFLGAKLTASKISAGEMNWPGICKKSLFYEFQLGKFYGGILCLRVQTRSAYFMPVHVIFILCIYATF